MSNAFKTIPLFPQSPVTPSEKDEKERQSVTDLVTDSLTTRARAYAREDDGEECAELVADIAAYYCETFGTSAMPPVARRRVEYALRQGMDASLIYTALDEAAMVRRPSWAYADAILRRLLAEGCLTPEAYEARQARWRQRRGYSDLL